MPAVWCGSIRSLDRSMLRPDQSEQGYALMEALVALAIAAGMLVATMSGLAEASKAARQANAMQQALTEARNIEARLRTGLSQTELAERYPDWQIELRPVDRPVDPRTGAVLSAAILSRPDMPGLDIRFIYVEPGALGSEGDYGRQPG